MSTLNIGNLGSSQKLGWSDVTLRNAGSGLLDLRNDIDEDMRIGLYNNNGSWDASTNYERGGMWWDSDIFKIGSVNAGTGNMRSVSYLGSSHAFYYGTGSLRLNIGSMDITAYKPFLANDGITGTKSLISGTGDEVAYTFNYTVNKATSGDDTGLLVNMTDTASPGTSLLADFQVGGSSKVAIDNTGTIEPDKGTVDEGFINFKATADADATSAISTLTTSGATTHHIQVEINGTKAWIAVSTTDPT